MAKKPNLEQVARYAAETDPMKTQNVKEVVREKYGQAARRVQAGAGKACSCGERSELEASCDPITSNFYNTAQAGEVPDAARRRRTN